MIEGILVGVVVCAISVIIFGIVKWYKSYKAGLEFLSMANRDLIEMYKLKQERDSEELREVLKQIQEEESNE